MRFLNMLRCTFVGFGVVVLTCSGCGSSSVTGDNSVPDPAAAIDKANTVQVEAAMKQAEMSMQACGAQNESFVGCALDAQTGTSVKITQATSAGFQLQSGEYVSTYTMQSGTACHATVTAPRACTSW